MSFFEEKMSLFLCYNNRMIKKAFEIKHLLPILSLIVLIATKGLVESSFWFSVSAIVFLGISVMSSVHHAEIIAH